MHILNVVSAIRIGMDNRAVYVIPEPQVYLYMAITRVTGAFTDTYIKRETSHAYQEMELAPRAVPTYDLIVLPPRVPPDLFVPRTTEDFKNTLLLYCSHRSLNLKLYISRPFVLIFLLNSVMQWNFVGLFYSLIIF